MSHSDEQGKMFVGGLSWESSQESLNSYFSKFGEVVDSVVMRNQETGRSRGFGFVTFRDPSCVEIVLASGPHTLDGRTVDPKACNPRNAAKVYEPKSTFLQQNRLKNLPKVFLGGLPASVTDTDLRNFFSKYGKVMQVVIMYDQEKKRSRGFGFLSFETEEICDSVCAEQYVTIGGKQVEVKKAEPRNRGDGYRGSNQDSWDGGSMPSQAMGAAQPAGNGMAQGMYQGMWTPDQYGYGWGAQAQTPAYGVQGQSYGAYQQQYPAAQYGQFAQGQYYPGWGSAPQAGAAAPPGDEGNAGAPPPANGSAPTDKQPDYSAYGAGYGGGYTAPVQSYGGGGNPSDNSGGGYGASRTSGGGQSQTYHPYRR